MKKVLTYDNEERVMFRKIYEFLAHIEAELDSEYELTDEREKVLDKAQNVIQEIESFFDDNNEEDE